MILAPDSDQTKTGTKQIKQAVPPTHHYPNCDKTKTGTKQGARPVLSLGSLYNPSINKIIFSKL